MSDSFVNSFFQAPDNKKESRKGLSVRMILFTQTGSLPLDTGGRNLNNFV